MIETTEKKSNSHAIALGDRGEEYIRDLLERRDCKVVIAPRGTLGLDLRAVLPAPLFISIGVQVKTNDRRTSTDSKYAYVKMTDPKLIKATGELWAVDRVVCCIVVINDDGVEVFWLNEAAQEEYVYSQDCGDFGFPLTKEAREEYENSSDVTVERYTDADYFDGLDDEPTT